MMTFVVLDLYRIDWLGRGSAPENVNLFLFTPHRSIDIDDIDDDGAIPSSQYLSNLCRTTIQVHCTRKLTTFSR